ncbi:MAG: T9SS type A sorting domain-containing protein [Bacteroidetes bacterium]|nr:T9SS type A sorting domain-containing protein [Bacteroidota bacterium]
MKKKFFFILLFFATFFAKGQFCGGQSVFIHNYGDTISSYFIKDTSCLWQVGSSDKTTLNYSGITIMTDTIAYYPPNVNSSFQLKIPAGDMGFSYLSCVYKTDTDSLADYGLIEVSIDNGYTWLNIDSLLGTTPPVLTGRTESGISYYFQYSLISGFSPNTCDTICYKFSFVSDSLDTYKEGIQFNSIQIVNWADFIYETSSKNTVFAFPNPSADEITLEFVQNNSENTLLEIKNLLGQTVYAETLKGNIGKQLKIVDVSVLQNGVYFIKLKNRDKIYSTKFIKQ